MQFIWKNSFVTSKSSFKRLENSQNLHFNHFSKWNLLVALLSSSSYGALPRPMPAKLKQNRTYLMLKNLKVSAAKLYLIYSFDVKGINEEKMGRIRVMKGEKAHLTYEMLFHLYCRLQLLYLQLHMLIQVVEF